MIDLISRQDAIDAVKEYFKFSPLEGRQCAKAIERVPSVQPDVSDTNVGDMISRQMAIDCMDKVIMFRIKPELKDRVATYLKSVPPAQPETAKRIVGKSRDGMTLWYQCDMCNEPVDVQDNYCRGCGRRLIDE